MDCCEKPMAVGRVFCPKPRRAAQYNINGSATMPLRFHIHSDADTRSGAESPSRFLRKSDFKAESVTLPSSPPFWLESPPHRTGNPLIHDAQFGNEKVTSMSKSHIHSALPELVHDKERLEMKQVAVRVEGFDCPSAHVCALS